jgi:hypothetical protein
VKNALKRKRFQDVEDVKKNATVEMRAPPSEAFADFSKPF